MNDLNGHPLPALNSASTAAERYLAAILLELQWQRAQQTPPAAVAKPVHGKKAA